jgi:hypothetical protein
MKTAMQDAIEHFKNINYDLVNVTIQNVSYILEQFLKKEKEQIMDAYCDGAKGGANGTKGQHENGWVSIQMRNKYYNQTYNKLIL